MKLYYNWIILTNIENYGIFEIWSEGCDVHLSCTIEIIQIHSVCMEIWTNLSDLMKHVDPFLSHCTIDSQQVKEEILALAGVLVEAQCRGTPPKEPEEVKEAKVSLDAATK